MGFAAGWWSGRRKETRWPYRAVSMPTPIRSRELDGDIKDLRNVKDSSHRAGDTRQALRESHELPPGNLWPGDPRDERSGPQAGPAATMCLIPSGFAA